MRSAAVMVRRPGVRMTPARINRTFGQVGSGKGYQIVDRRTANPIARLCPIPDTDRFELFYWSNTKGRWTTFGNFGRMKLMLESAHEIVENDPMFRVPRHR